MDVLNHIVHFWNGSTQYFFFSCSQTTFRRCSIPWCTIQHERRHLRQRYASQSRCAVASKRHGIRRFGRCGVVEKSGSHSTLPDQCIGVGHVVGVVKLPLWNLKQSLQVKGAFINDVTQICLPPFEGMPDILRGWQKSP